MSKRSHRRARQPKRTPGQRVVLIGETGRVQETTFQQITSQVSLGMGAFPQALLKTFSTLAAQMQSLAWDFKSLLGPSYHTLDPRTQRRVHNFRLIEPGLRKKYARPK